MWLYWLIGYCVMSYAVMFFIIWWGNKRQIPHHDVDLKLAWMTSPLSLPLSIIAAILLCINDD